MTMSVLNDRGFLVYLGIFLGVSFFIIIVIVIFGVIFYCLYKKSKRRRRKGYTAVQGEYHGRDDCHLVTSVDLRQAAGNESVLETIQRQTNEQEQQRREFALLSCQFYLRSVPEYELDHQLPDIGSRMSKNWFLVRQIRRTTHNTLLTMLPVSQHCRLNLQEDKTILKRLCKALDHMNIHQLLDIDYIPDRRLVVITEPLHTRGSLKDLVYQTTPNLSWSTKYSVRRSGLKIKQVRSFGRQVLHGVLFLYHLGFKPLGQIQSGNIYLEGGTIKLSGYENLLLGYKPRIYRLVKEYKTRIDSAMFGHLLFELSSGRELSNAQPTEADFASIKLDEIEEVLKYIFCNKISEMPNIEEILQHSFFYEESSTSLDLWSYEGVRLDEGMKSIIVKAKTGKLSKGSGSATSGKKIQKSSASKYPIYQQTKSSTFPPTAQSPNPTALEENKQKNSKKNQVQSFDVATEVSPSKDRSALLGDIRSGTSLRKTVTNDRSAPVLH